MTLQPGTAARRKLLALLSGGLILVAPLLLSNLLNTIVIFALLSAMVAAGVALLYGYTAQLSFGQGAFYAVGAYSSAVLSIHGMPPILGLLIGPLVAMAISLVIGLAVLRLSGHYLAFASLAVQLIVLAIISQFNWLGADVGLRDVPGLGASFGLALKPPHYTIVALLAVGFITLICFRLTRSPAGRAMAAVGNGEAAAAASGINVARVKIMVFIVAGGFAGLAGAVYAHFVGYVSPDSFPVLLSVEFVVMAVIGGVRLLSGPIVGAVVITALLQVLNWVGTLEGVPHAAPVVLSYASYGVLLVVVILFLPHGVVFGLKQLARKYLSRRNDIPKPVESESLRVNT